MPPVPTIWRTRSRAASRWSPTSRPGAIADAVQDADGIPDRIDSVIHAAGIVELGRVGDLPVSAWESQLAVNLTAPAELTRLLLPRVRAARGQVVFVNSGAGLTAHPQWAAYAASKHGLKALADALRGEEAEHGVRVTTVYPGRTATPMQAEVHAQEGGLRPRPVDRPGVGRHGRAHGARSSARRGHQRPDRAPRPAMTDVTRRRRRPARRRALRRPPASGGIAARASG
jgi:NAD(P)-dependent dehydrogenase (short-subunit alcohol dehydrogenase family)